MKQHYTENLFTKLRRPKLQPKVWIKLSELNKYVRVVVWLTSNVASLDVLMTFMAHIKRLVSKGGWNFCFLYLKEAQRLLVRALSGSPEPKETRKNVILVARDSHGLPRIVPIDLRAKLLKFKQNQSLVKTLLTILSVYRVFPTKPKPKLSTITDPFNGTSDQLVNLEEAVYEVLGKSKIKLSSPKLIKLETAGPNASKSAWSSGIDTLAFLHFPAEFISFARYCINTKARLYLIWACFLILIAAFPYTVLLVTGKIKPLKLGKLGIVKDQAGKARIIAICSYWIQLVLKPLHNALFSRLRHLITDGTFDQHAPLDRLVKLCDGSQKFSCFDLSAATDRLPIRIQRDILNIAVYKGYGDLWASLLNIPWFYEERYVRYAVGQPMGAYSSWGMLAVTHHVIVRYAALKCGIRGFTSYAVLGDDIVILHDEVAKMYLSIMQHLGVSINFNKSIVSSEFAEFAKVWRGPSVDITPIGPGLILRTVRDDKYKGILLGEAVRLNLIETLPQLLTLIRDLKDPLLALWSTLGAGSARWDNQANAQAITWGLTSMSDQRLFLYCLGNSIKQNFLNEWRESMLSNQKEKEHFYTTWWKVYSSNGWPSRVLEALLKLFGPGFWIYAFSFLEARETFAKPCPIHTYGYDNLVEIQRMVNLDPLLNLSSIDWREKKKISKYDSKVKHIANEFDRTLSEMQDFSEML